MSLAKLPDDLVLEVVSHLNTARDVASLARCCRGLHGLVSRDGWRAFVRRYFSTLRAGEPKDGRGWDGLADALTRQSRHWDKKSFRLTAYTDTHTRHGNFFAGYGDQAHPFSPVLDAGLVYDDRFELVAWGAGEDVVGRFRPLGGRAGAEGGRGDRNDAWFRMQGQRNGFKAVTGDVTSVKLVEPGGKLGLLVGRASGDLQLVSASGQDAGQAVRSFAMPAPPTTVKAASWNAIGYADVLPEQTSILAGNRSTVAVFPLASEPSYSPQRQQTNGTAAVKASASHVFVGSSSKRPPFVHSATFLSAGDTIACALGADEQPLRWLGLTPSGLVPKTIDKDAALLRPLTSNPKTTIRALTAVGAGSGLSRGDDLLLTAWDDGTVRLLDPRTSSPCDLVYRDIFQPDETLSSLLSWGTSRFVAGSNEYPHLKTFDYRWPLAPLSYHSTDALPCSSHLPVPPPPRDDYLAGSPDLDLDFDIDLDGHQSQGQQNDCVAATALSARCDHAGGSGGFCSFHRASRSPRYRPNSCLILQGFSTSHARARPARIHALAKASDSSDSFYAGLPGAVAEVQMGTAGPSGSDLGPSSAARQAASKRGWRADVADFCFLETGHGTVDLTEGYPGLGVSSFSPVLVQRRDVRGGPESKSGSGPRKWAPMHVGAAEGARHRWDQRFWRPSHFEHGAL